MTHTPTLSVCHTAVRMLIVCDLIQTGEYVKSNLEASGAATPTSSSSASSSSTTKTKKADKDKDKKEKDKKDKKDKKEKRKTGGDLTVEEPSSGDGDATRSSSGTKRSWRKSLSFKSGSGSSVSK
jgi:hypothetical protein